MYLQQVAQGLFLLAALLPTTLADKGFFIVHCGPLTVQRADPIVSPGQLSSHVHAVVGGTAFRLGMAPGLAATSRATTCDKTLDKSNYWQPQLYHQNRDGKLELVPLLGIGAYYLDRVCDYKEGRQNCDGTPSAIPPPVGLRMITGNTSRRSYDSSKPEQRAISHVCLDPGQDYVELHQAPCAEMRAQTYFPSCWNGKDLDSPDHKSHMAFPAIGDYNGGVCPQSHPVAVISVFTEFFYGTRSIKDFNRWVYANGDTTGYGLHADFIHGWTDQGALSRAFSTCVGPQGTDDPNCSLRIGGNGPGEVSSQPLEVKPPSEEVGLNGDLDKLPGNNPIYMPSAKFMV